MAEKIEHDAHQLPSIGTRVVSGDAAPGFGTWEIVDHDGCPGSGLLHPAGRGDELPPCPVCGTSVTWQLTHLSTSVAVDHKGTTPLP